MLTDIVSIGNKLEIKSKTEKNKAYLSQIEDIKEEKFIRISAPICEGKIIPLTVGATYEIVVLVKENCYLCKGIITDRGKDNNLHFMEIEVTTELIKHQRRNFFRFKCLIEMKYIAFKNYENLNKINQSITNLNFNSIISYSEKNGKFKIYDAIIKDISGGGIRFISNHMLERGNSIKSAILLDNTVVNIDSEIIQVNMINNELYKYEYQAQYLMISNENREKIVKFIFNAQRKLLQKEKGM
jgi:c-di-GMP-binding flagellar brake protein YcgR